MSHRARQKVGHPVPLLDVTDLYHPHQDYGDNFDLLLPFALSAEVDLRGVVLE